MDLTLGGLILAGRNLAGVTQAQLCDALGWEAREAYRLSDLERGKRTWVDLYPAGSTADEGRGRAALERLLDRLSASPADRTQALRLAGYAPTPAEAERVLRVLTPLVDQTDPPAYVMDFTWRLWDANELALQRYGLAMSRRDVQEKRPNILQIGFDTGVPLVERLNDTHFLRTQLALFKAEHVDHQHHEWYRDLISGLLTKPAFREIWETLPDALILRYIELRKIEGVNAVRLLNSDRRETTYAILSWPYTDDERFRLRQLVPMDTVTSNPRLFTLPRGADTDVQELVPAS